MIKILLTVIKSQLYAHIIKLGKRKWRQNFQQGNHLETNPIFVLVLDGVIGVEKIWEKVMFFF